MKSYDSEAVRKVTEYLLSSVSISNKQAKEDAREIVKLVHEAEDADE